MNLVQTLFGGKRHAQISQNELSNLTPGNLLKSYQGDLDPSKVKQLPGFVVPKIHHQQVMGMATTAGVMQAEHGAKVMAQKVDNAKKVLKAAAQIEAKSAELAAAYGDYQAQRMEAEYTKQQANAQIGSKAASLAVGYNQTAYQLQSAVDVARRQIHCSADQYEQVGGF